MSGSGEPVHGVVVVDKPAGMTSHDVVAAVRRIANQRKVGHTGTLDPDATGVLVLCLGRATRLTPFLQLGDKTYAADMVLGRETTTQDASGEVVAERDASHVTEHDLCLAMDGFRGEIEQIPPMVSAVKVGGERLHAKARRGETVERQPRRVTIHDLVLEDFAPGPLARASFLVTCSKGAYVRTLAHDLGRALGVGGSLTALRRLANGVFTDGDAVGLDELRERGLGHALTPVEKALAALPRVDVTAEEARALVHGRPRPAADLEGPWTAFHDGRLVGVLEDRDGRGRPLMVWLRPEDLAPAGTGS